MLYNIQMYLATDKLDSTQQTNDSNKTSNVLRDNIQIYLETDKLDITPNLKLIKKKINISD